MKPWQTYPQHVTVTRQIDVNFLPTFQKLFCDHGNGPPGRVVARKCYFFEVASAGGKSGLHRAACRLTAGGIRSKRIPRKVPQKIYRRRVSVGKGEKVR